MDDRRRIWSALAGVEDAVVRASVEDAALEQGNAGRPMGAVS